MDTATILLLVVGLGLAAVIGIWFLLQNRRSARLRNQFGPEYDHALETAGSRREAEKDLEARTRRVEKLHLKELPSERRARYYEEWRIAQAHFVDDPGAAISESHRLVQRVMIERGYPPADIDQRGADISVDHPEVVSHYRAANAIVHAYEDGAATTEDLRQAIIHHRALFAELLGEVPVGAR
jgi:hypothetical protein